MSRQFITVTGVVAPLIMDDVNTDLIIPIHHCVNTARKEFGRYAFEAIRYQADGTNNPHFIFNKPQYHGASILLAGTNFGYGSSREPAAWALDGMGVRVVIARSFGGIFYANCLRNGLLPIPLPLNAHNRLVELTSGDQALTITVDLRECAVILPGAELLYFEIEPARRRALLEGLDEIGQTLLSMPDIIAFQEQDQIRRPWVWEPLQSLSGVGDTNRGRPNREL